jgi:hypothetical protein
LSQGEQAASLVFPSIVSPDGYLAVTEILASEETSFASSKQLENHSHLSESFLS